jgi:hypothetical protein
MAYTARSNFAPALRRVERGNTNETAMTAKNSIAEISDVVPVRSSHDEQRIPRPAASIEHRPRQRVDLARRFIAAVMLVLGWSVTAAAQTITEYPLPTANGFVLARTAGPNGTPIFGVLATASAAIPDLPAIDRVFVRFTDANGVLRGETSVAIRTQ